MTVKKLILSRHAGLEKAEVVRICYAVESGSRAWGRGGLEREAGLRSMS